jgi:Acyl-CoA reductase (LuxC)
MPKSSPPAAASGIRHPTGARHPSGARQLSARRILSAIADAAWRWTDADFPPRVRATRAVMERTGYTEPVVDFALDRLFEALTAPALTAAIEGELGSLEALDHFIVRNGRPDGFARPIGRVAVVASDTTIGVALPPALYALCAKCEVIVRDRSDALTGAFAATLAEESAALAARLRTVAGGSHDDRAWLAELGKADAVVAFGGEEALRALREQTRVQARFVPFGHRTSATFVAREAFESSSFVAAVAEGIARDALLYDGEGCLSSHAVFIETDDPAHFDRFTGIVAAALDRSAVEFPPAPSGASSAVSGYRQSAEFRATQGSGRVLRSQAGVHLLVVEPPRDEPPPLLPRTLAMYCVAAPEEFARFVATHRLPLEAVAVEPFPVREDLHETILQTGTARIARIGTLQSPSLAGEHGGFGRIAPFVRWVTRDR